MKERLIALSQGNPGALRVLCDLVSTQDPDRMLAPLEEHGVRGPGIWILYKDRCNQDLGALVDLLLRPPSNLLEMSYDR